MYPLEEGYNGDYVELIHFLNKLNKRYLDVTGKSAELFEMFKTERYPVILKKIKASKDETEFKENMKELFSNYDEKVFECLNKSETISKGVEGIFMEIGKIKAEEKAKEMPLIVPMISPRKIDDVSMDLLSAKKQYKNAVANVHEMKNLLNGGLKVKGDEMKAQVKQACEKYLGDLKGSREKYFGLALDYNEMMFENVHIGKINEQRKANSKNQGMEA